MVRISFKKKKQLNKFIKAKGPKKNYTYVYPHIKENENVKLAQYINLNVKNFSVLIFFFF